MEPQESVSREGEPRPDPQTAELDMEVLIENFGGDRELFKQVLELFFNDVPRLLSNLEAALASGDATALRAAAHSLKGAVGYFSCGAVYEKVYALEMVGKEGQLAPAVGLFRQLKPEIEALVAALVEFQQKV